MSDEFRRCERQFKWNVELSHPDLSYAAKTRKNKAILALEIPYPLLKEWHRIINGGGLGEKTVDGQDVPDYISLLEISIPSSLFAFTDDQETRSQINDNLWKISTSVVQLYKKTKGRKRKELDNRVRKFHVMAGQTKSQEDYEEEINQLKSAAENWRSKYQNLEVEKRNLYNEMLEVINQKERTINHLQNENQQLLNYITDIEKVANIHCQYKGKHLSSSQNKSRTLKTFMSRAETALWFSKNFGLDIESMLIKESDTGKKHTVTFEAVTKETQDSTANSEPSEKSNRYNNLTEEHKKQIEEILFVLDKFCVGDAFYHQFTMMTNGLPKSYLIQQCRSDLNKLCCIDPLPGKLTGSKVHSVRDVMKEHILDYIKENPNFDPAKENIQIKISGDGARMTRNSSFILLSFSILQTGQEVMSAKGNRTIAVVNGKEEYSNLKESFGEIFHEINEMISEGMIDTGRQEIKTEFFLGGDYKYILLMLGLNSAAANYSCAWCKVYKLDRWKMDHDFKYFNMPPMARTLQEIRDLLQHSKDNYGCINEPLLNIEVDHIIVDELHLLLRVTDVLMANLITEVMEWDKEDEFDKKGGAENVHLEKLIDTIRSCGVSFEVWEKKNADGKGSGTYDWTSLMGNDKKTLMNYLPDKMMKFLRPDTAEAVVKLWKDFQSVYKVVSNWEPKSSAMELWMMAKEWVNSFVALSGKREGYERKRVTPYIHIMATHIPWFFEKYSAIKMFTGQGVEKNNDVARSIVLRKSNKWDSTGDVLRFESRQWLLKHRERETREYNKRNLEYWDNDIKNKKRKSHAPSLQSREQLQGIQENTSAVYDPPTTSGSLPNPPPNFAKMTVPQLKHQLKQKGIKGISKKSKQQLINIMKSIN